MEVEVGAGLVTSDEESSVALVRRSSKTKSIVNFRENGSNGTVKRESETNRDSVAAADDKSLDAQVAGSLIIKSDNSIEENGPHRALMLRSEKDKLSMKIFSDVGVTDKLVQNAEERTGGEGFEAAKMNSKSINEGFNGNSPSSSMRPTNASEVMAMPFDSPHSHSKTTLQTSVYFVEEKGSESTELLERGGASLDYESENMEFVKSEKVIQTMTEIKKNQNWAPAEEIWEHNLIDPETSTGAFITESFVTSNSNHSETREKGKNVCIDTDVFSDSRSTVTVRNGDLTINKEEEEAGNGGFKQHQHGHSVSESARQNSNNSTLNEQDEGKLKEYWTRILENSEFEGKVETIVKILKKQQSHDVICPVCRSCITEHVILRKRDDEKAIVSEGEHDITENQNEDGEPIEAYGCLACFSLFFRRGREKADFAVPASSTLLQEPRERVENEKDIFSCLPFRYPWGHRIKIEPEKDEKQLEEPLLRKDDCEEVISPLKPGSAGSSCLETQSKVDDSFSPSPEISENAGNIVPPSHAAVETVIGIERTSDPRSAIPATVASEFGNTSSELQDSSVATEWDLLKSIVYGGLTVSITSLGVVSSAAGADAKTLTVIAIALANLVSGLFLIFNNILHLSYQERVETVGHSFWFNGFVAIFSYLVFGSLAPLTYGFSFQKSDDILYKFLAASIVSLVSIILLALGKAAVTTKNYIRVVILYVVTGFWASFIGFFAGEYIKKLLEKWGFVTD